MASKRTPIDDQRITITGRLVMPLVSSLRGAVVFMLIPGVRAHAVSIPVDRTTQDRQFIDRLDYS